MATLRTIVVALSCMALAWALTACTTSADDDAIGPDASGAGKTAKGLPSPSHQAATEIVEVPVTGVGLGWGYNLYDSEALPNKCVEFSEAEEPAQTRTMSMKEVNDSYEVMKTMGMTAEASVAAMGFEASGKASYAKDLNISGTSTNFVLDASVDNGVRYAAPYEPSAENGITVGPRQRAIRLTPAAERLAKDPEEFLRQCGNGYVSAVYSGARLTAVISIQTQSRAEKEDVRAEVSAKGWGATVSGSMHQGTQTQASKTDKSMSVFLVGGRGDAIPKNQQELEAKLETLSYAAYEAPKDFRMAVTPYEILPNWPQEQELRGNVTEFEQLAGLWGDYNTLYDEIEHILENAALYAAVVGEVENFSAVPLLPNTETGASQIRYLEKLQDYVHQELRDLEQIARNCLVAEEDGIDNDVECLFDESQHLNSYGFRSQLPLELPMAVATTPPAACTGANATPEKLPACQAAYTKAFLDLMTHPVSLDRLVAERWIIDKSQGRCRFDVLDLGCLTNNEVRAWQSKVGKRLTLVAESDRGKLSQLNLDIDPAIGAIWSTAAEEKAIADALSASSTLTVGALQ